MELKTKTSLTLTPTVQYLLGELAERMGVSKSDAIEVIIREVARKEGIAIPKRANSQEAKQPKGKGTA